MKVEAPGGEWDWNVGMIKDDVGVRCRVSWRFEMCGFRLMGCGSYPTI